MQNKAPTLVGDTYLSLARQPLAQRGDKILKAWTKKSPYGKIKATDNRKNKTIGGSPQMKEDIIGLAHIKWRCQYHLVFEPKYRRKYFLKRKD